MDGKCIDEFVGYEAANHIAEWQSIRNQPFDLRGVSAHSAIRIIRRISFDADVSQLMGELIAQLFGSSADIIGKQSVPCTHLDDGEIGRTAQAPPHALELHSKQCAECRMHCRAGVEITGRAKRLFAGVVAANRMIQRHLHELCKRDSSPLPDAFPYRLLGCRGLIHIVIDRRKGTPLIK